MRFLSHGITYLLLPIKYHLTMEKQHPKAGRFYELAHQAEPSNVAQLAEVARLLALHDDRTASYWLIKKYNDFLAVLSEGNIQKRAEAYNFCVLVCGRFSEFFPDQASQIDNLGRGFFSDFACEMMAALEPDPAPTALSAENLQSMLRCFLDGSQNWRKQWW
jgi:hypothetical protein